MAVITFMSDFGTDDHYVAVVKGKILSKNPNQQIVDISHAIKPYDIAHGATILKAVFREFPEGTVHLVAVDSLKSRSKGIAMELERHLFVGFDCGLLSMISNKKPLNKVRIALRETTFPARDVLATAALKLACGALLSDLGGHLDQMEELLARQLKVTKREIVGNVVNVDHYGNLITNITKQEFDKILQLNDENTRYTISFGREVSNKIHGYYTDVDAGDYFALFNSMGCLQIGINQGNAAQLIDLGIDASVRIEFQPG